VRTAGGEPQLIGAALAPLPASVRARATVVAASQVVAMADKPREAIRRKKDSSMRLAIDLVQDGRACACVSAGNTGALTAIGLRAGNSARRERAAIISAIPAAHGHTHMLDLGANTKATPEQLRQFGRHGRHHRARRVRPGGGRAIGLLNIGEEDMKGDQWCKAAHAAARASGLNYVAS